MVKKIKQMMLKAMMPKPESIAKIAAKAAADFVNSSDKQTVIAGFIEKAQKLENAQMMVTKWLVDGKFDEAEVKELQQLLEPVAEALYNKVLQKIGE